MSKHSAIESKLRKPLEDLTLDDFYLCSVLADIWFKQGSLTAYNLDLLRRMVKHTCDWLNRGLTGVDIRERTQKAAVDLVCKCYYTRTKDDWDLFSIDTLLSYECWDAYKIYPSLPTTSDPTLLTIKD